MKKNLSLFLALTISAGVIKAAQLWPVILDDVTYSNVEQYVVNDFRENDENQFMYIWDDTYERSIGTGENFFCTGEDYLSLYTTDLGWSGLGFCLTDDGNGWQAAETLRAAIVNNPDNYFLHLAIKSTDNYSHCFYILGNDLYTKFVLGSSSIYDGSIYGNYERDGEWHDFYIPMSRFASTLANMTCTPGVNVFGALTEGVQGAQLNLDAVYFCDMEMIAIIPSPNKVQIGDYYYNIQDNKNTANLVSCVPNLIGDISIPAKVQYEGKEYDVTGIFGYAFVNRSNITTITLPNSITYIGSEAFNGCSSLRAIYVPCGELERFQQLSPDSRIMNVPLRYKIEAEHGYITSDKSFYSICDEHQLATFWVTPYYGYHFTQWSDGNTDNPRTVELVQDATFTAEFAVDRSGACGDNNALIWVFDPITKALTIRGEGALNRNYTFGLEAPESVQKIVIESGVSSVGNGAFKDKITLNEIVISHGVNTIQTEAFSGCTELTTITLGANLLSIGEHAFDGCKRIEEITVYAERVIDITETTFANIGKKEYVYVNVPEGSLRKYQRDDYWSEFDLRVIGATTTTVADDDVNVEPTTNTADVTWPAVENASIYELTIKDKNGNVICTLIFNAQGQLTSIAFAAPGRGQHAAQVAGFTFTVTGLDSGSSYDFTMEAKNSQGEVIDTKEGSFTTSSIDTAVDNASVDTNPIKVIRNGQLFILRGDKTYSVQGQEVK